MELRSKLLKLIKTPRLTFLPAAAAFISVFLFWEIHSYFKAKEASLLEPRYLIARRDLSAATPASFSDFTLLPSRLAAKNVPSAALTDQDLSLLSGAMLAKPITQGEILTFGHLRQRPVKGISAAVPPGRRAYSLQDLSVPEIRAGDRVDIHYTSVEPATMGAILLEDVLVLRSVFEESRLMVAVLPEDIALLERARQTGTLTVVLRNPQERRQAGQRGRNPWPHRATSKARIEIWAESE